MDVIAYIVPPLSALAGVVITQLFNRWQRREYFQRMIFDEKLKAYRKLCGLNTNLVGSVINAGAYEVIPEQICIASNAVIRFMQANKLLVSPDVEALVGEIRKSIPQNIVKGYPEAMPCNVLIMTNDRLKETCREELGLDCFDNHTGNFS